MLVKIMFSSVLFNLLAILFCFRQLIKVFYPVLYYSIDIFRFFIKIEANSHKILRLPAYYNHGVCKNYLQYSFK